MAYLLARFTHVPTIFCSIIFVKIHNFPKEQMIITKKNGSKQGNFDFKGNKVISLC